MSAGVRDCVDRDKKLRAKRTHIEAFVSTFLSCLSSALNDGSERRKRLAADMNRFSELACNDGEGGNRLTPAMAILEARKRLGKDNDAYLQCGLMVLWSGDTLSHDVEFQLYPSTLPTPPGARQSALLQEERIVEQLVDQTNSELRGLRAYLEREAAPRMTYLLFVPEVRVYALEMLRRAIEVRQRREANGDAEVVGRLRALAEILTDNESGGAVNPVEMRRARMQRVASWVVVEGRRMTSGMEHPSQTGGDATGRAPPPELPLSVVAAIVGSLCDPDHAGRLVSSLFPLEGVVHDIAKDAPALCASLRGVVGGIGPTEEAELVDVRAPVERAVLGLYDRELYTRCPSNGGEPSSGAGVSLVEMDEEEEEAVGPFGPHGATGFEPPFLRRLFAPDVLRNVGRDKARRMFASPRWGRAAASVALNLYRGGVCEIPPHMLFKERAVRAYAVPPLDRNVVGVSALRGDGADEHGWDLCDSQSAPNVDASSARVRVAQHLSETLDLHRPFTELALGSAYEWVEQRGEREDNELAPFFTSHPNDGVASALDGGVEPRYVRVPGMINRVLWSPTVSSNDRGEGATSGTNPRMGNVSLTDSSLHTSYATYLAAAMGRMAVATDGADGDGAVVARLASLWKRAVLKLEMMPSLRWIYRRLSEGYDVQEDISGSGGLATERGARVALSKTVLDYAKNRPADDSSARAEKAEDALLHQMPNEGGVRALLTGVVTEGTINTVFVAIGGIAGVIPGPNAYLDVDVREAVSNPPVSCRLYAAFDVAAATGAAETTLVRRTDFQETDRSAQLSQIPAYASPGCAADMAHRILETPSRVATLSASVEAYRNALVEMRTGRPLPSREGGGGASGDPRGCGAPGGVVGGVPQVADQDERERRNAIWQDALRELAVGGDRLYTFLKVMAGVLHEDVTAILKLEDRSMEANQRMYREQRRDAMRDVTAFSQRVVDTVLASVFRQSKLKVDLDVASAQGSKHGSRAANEVASSLVVVSDEGIERVNELASGTTGLNFLEANAQLRQYLQTKRGSPIPLKDLVSDMRDILNAHRTYVLNALQANQDQGARSSMEYLAEPKNSLVIRLRPETFAAIRTAYDLLSVELRQKGWSAARVPTAWECMEGPVSELTNQFAQLAAYQLAHGRTFSSSSAIYVSANAARTNMQMLRIALQKTVRRVQEYRQKAR